MPEPPCKERAGRALGPVTGAESSHSSEVPMGDWLSLFLLDFLSPSLSQVAVSCPHSHKLAHSSSNKAPAVPPSQSGTTGKACWLPFCTLWTCSGDCAPRSFSSWALSIINCVSSWEAGAEQAAPRTNSNTVAHPPHTGSWALPSSAVRRGQMH